MGGTATGTVTYYPVAGAMRVNSTLYFVLKDNLSSASVVTDAAGTVVGEDRFYPFGETRFTTGNMFTDKLFTGQREITGLGIYHYGARFYSPKLGRFLSADTMVPGYANPQNLNRYSYVLNNPLGYIDPTGHNPCRSDYLCKRRAERMAATQAANATDKTAHPGMVAQPACFSCTYSGGGGVNPAPVPSSGGSTPDYCSTHPGSCGIPAPVVTPPVLPTAGTAGGTPPSSFTQAPPPPGIKWCVPLDCILSGVSVIASAFTFFPPPIDEIAFGIDVVATVWAGLRTWSDYDQGKISSTRFWSLEITGAVGAIPAIPGVWWTGIGTASSFANLFMTLLGIPN